MVGGEVDANAIAKIIGGAICIHTGYTVGHLKFNQSVRVAAGDSPATCPLSAWMHISKCRSCDGTCPWTGLCRQVKIILGYIYANDGETCFLRGFAKLPFPVDPAHPASVHGSTFAEVIGHSGVAMTSLQKVSTAQLMSYEGGYTHPDEAGGGPQDGRIPYNEHVSL